MIDISKSLYVLSVIFIVTGIFAYIIHNIYRDLLELKRVSSENRQRLDELDSKEGISASRVISDYVNNYEGSSSSESSLSSDDVVEDVEEDDVEDVVEEACDLAEQKIVEVN